MKRLFIFKAVRTGEELILPVTPSGYELEAGRKVEPLDMQETGTLNLPGLKTLLDKGIQCMFPAQAYPFINAGTVLDPWYYVKKFKAFSEAAEVLRFVVSDTDVNEPVLVESITYGEQDGTGDVYATIQLKGYRDVTAPQVERTADDASKNAPRAATETQEESQQTYVVVKGDSLWSICKKFYGDGSLAYRLAAANNIANPNLIYPGQVLTIPAFTTLRQTQPAPASASPREKAQNQAEEAKAQEDAGTPAAKPGEKKVENVPVYVIYTGEKNGMIRIQTRDRAGKSLGSKVFTATGYMIVPKGTAIAADWWGDKGVYAEKVVATYAGSAHTATSMGYINFTANAACYLSVTWSPNNSGNFGGRR